MDVLAIKAPSRPDREKVDHTEDGNRVDPKIVAALVNRFVADSAEFLQAFAQQAEVRLLELTTKIGRLERLLQLFERKLANLPTEGVEPPPPVAEPTATPAKPGAKGKAKAKAKGKAPPPPSQQAKQAAEASEPEAAAAEEESAPAPTGGGGANIHDRLNHPPYDAYMKMLKFGLSWGAAHQKMVKDSIAYPEWNLDLTALDHLPGAQPVPAVTAAIVPRPKAAAAPSTTGEDAPAAAPAPAPSGGNMMDEIIRKQKARQSRMEDGLVVQREIKPTASPRPELANPAPVVPAEPKPLTAEGEKNMLSAPPKVEKTEEEAAAPKADLFGKAPAAAPKPAAAPPPVTAPAATESPDKVLDRWRAIRGGDDSDSNKSDVSDF